MSNAKRTPARKTATEIPNRPGATLSPVEIPVSMAHGVAELVRLTGLEEAAVVRHCLSSALFWAGLNGYGRASFEFLMEATMGEGNAEKFRGQALEDCCAVEMEAAGYIAVRQGREVLAAFPGDWPAEAGA